MRLRNPTCLAAGVYSIPARDGDIQIVATGTCSGRPLYLFDLQGHRTATDGYRRREHACATLDLSDLLSLESLCRGLAIEAVEADDQRQPALPMVLA